MLESTIDYKNLKDYLVKHGQDTISKSRLLGLIFEFLHPGHEGRGETAIIEFMERDKISAYKNHRIICNISHILYDANIIAIDGDSDNYRLTC